MKRREFIGIAGGMAAWPLVAQAQQRGRMPIVSILWHGSEERELANPFFHWVVQGFENAGLKPGVNVILDHQFADESDAKYAELAPLMVAKRPDLLLAIALPPTLALVKVHGEIPLVFLGSFDPIAQGVVDNLAKRNKPVTGISGLSADLSAKRLKIGRAHV